MNESTWPRAHGRVRVRACVQLYVNESTLPLAVAHRRSLSCLASPAAGGACACACARHAVRMRACAPRAQRALVFFSERNRTDQVVVSVLDSARVSILRLYGVQQIVDIGHTIQIARTRQRVAANKSRLPAAQQDARSDHRQEQVSKCEGEMIGPLPAVVSLLVCACTVQGQVVKDGDMFNPGALVVDRQQSNEVNFVHVHI